ncbi:LysR family transcriptional regulator [Chitinasiproducens palmae]|uniref:Transcriptional regulator, LysR family n=1 Tax=Chitinasiproducens palmae TaxID=1770053 RepID=A0A1H2PLA8_9BURK|nr:LysR family transcriptional regulator [Chitinasiproducens palmae]SDV46853.1 transcriptional regulator, LysR family [Chitinasiproducens palmae]
MDKLPDLQDLQVFCTVVRHRSFARTALELDASTSWVSKRIGLLERSLGTRLLHRTTRQMTLTEDGEAVHLWAQRVLGDIGEMQGAVSSVRTEPRGTLRISSSFRLGRALIAPTVAELVRKHPLLDVSLVVLDRPVDLIAESLDLDVRIGAVPEPHLIAHSLGTSQRVLCASPAYLAARGIPDTPDDLRHHSCLVFRERDQPFGIWRLQRGGDMRNVRVSGALASNSNDIIWQWALAGHGIMRASAWDCEASLASGELVRVLPDWEWPADIWAATTSRLSQSAKVRLCVQALRDRLGRLPFMARAPV